MASDYKSYLAANILGEDRVITYRTLSRALRVHGNVAKEMLYEFHRLQNGKKPGSIHAVYLVAGTKKKLAHVITHGLATSDSAEIPIQSSPYRSSPDPDTDDALDESPILAITLVREADLQELRSKFGAILSVHVYSLASHPLKDLQSLSYVTTNTTNVYTDLYTHEDCSVYGIVVNKYMKRRKEIHSPTPTAITGAHILEKITNFPNRQVDENFVDNPSTTGKPNLDPHSGPRSSSISGSGTGKSLQEKRKAPPNILQRHDSSNIFKSFAKSKPKFNYEATDHSTGAPGLHLTPPNNAEDETMKYTSEDEEESYVTSVQTSSESVEAFRKSRTERATALKNMMDEDDPAQEYKTTLSGVKSHELTEEALASQSVEKAAQTIDGRRRGKRRILKKKTIKDEDGYLVTKEEPVWESFSEDEVVVATKPKASFSNTSEAAKKGPSKPGQGSIMSFFGKK